MTKFKSLLLTPFLIFAFSFGRTDEFFPSFFKSMGKLDNANYWLQTWQLEKNGDDLTLVVLGISIGADPGSIYYRMNKKDSTELFERLYQLLTQGEQCRPIGENNAIRFNGRVLKLSGDLIAGNTYKITSIGYEDRYIFL